MLFVIKIDEKGIHIGSAVTLSYLYETLEKLSLSLPKEQVKKN